MKRDLFGVLVIHGFTATLESVNPLVEFLEKLQIPVSAPLLKGHGGPSPEKLRGVTWRDWLLDAETAFHELSEKVDRIIVAGHSMGALVALNLAAKYQRGKLDSVVLAAPAFRLVSLFGPGRPFHFLVPLLKVFIKSWNLDVAESDRNKKGIPVHYTWAPTDAIKSFFDLISYTESRLDDIRCPMLIIHNRHDQTVRQDSLDIVYHGVATDAADKEVIWFERSEHQMFCDSENQKVIGSVIGFIDSRSSKNAEQVQGISI